MKKATKIGIAILRADGVVQTLSEVNVPDWFDISTAKETKFGLIFKKDAAINFIRLKEVI